MARPGKYISLSGSFPAAVMQAQKPKPPPAAPNQQKYERAADRDEPRGEVPWRGSSVSQSGAFHFSPHRVMTANGEPTVTRSRPIIVPLYLNIRA